jgi:hypothetical protein
MNFDAQQKGRFEAYGYVFYAPALVLEVLFLHVANAINAIA